MKDTELLIHVGGAKGVGKTTIFEQGINLPEYAIKTIPMSFLLNEFGKLEFGLDWMYLDSTQKTYIRKVALKYILSLKDDAVLLDSHYIDINDSGVEPIMSKELQNLIDVHIIIESSPEEILRRRLNDISRKRSYDMGMIEKEIASERNAATEIANNFKKPIYVIKNENINNTVLEIISIVKMEILKKQFTINRECLIVK